MRITPELREFAKAVFRGDTSQPPCGDCGGIHQRACPRIKRLHVMMSADGVIVDRDVTYWPPGQWEAGIVFPEDVYEQDDAEGGDADAAQGAGDAGPGTDLAAHSSGTAA